ncbi:MAG: cupredoxin domain-containing protein [Candidatus Eisenbacteria bacterium]|nr:cupredoxin domain-containing protein [Candidatus Eisenbacteria bacterium]
MTRILTLTLALAATAGSLALASAAPAPAREQKVVLTVTKKGFEPAAVRVFADRPVRLVVTRKAEGTCATEIVLKDYGIQRPLPLGKTVEVRFTPKKAGTIRYACAMDMIAGKIVVQ